MVGSPFNTIQKGRPIAGPQHQRLCPNLEVCKLQSDQLGLASASFGWGWFLRRYPNAAHGIVAT